MWLPKTCVINTNPRSVTICPTELTANKMRQVSVLSYREHVCLDIFFATQQSKCAPTSVEMWLTLPKTYNLTSRLTYSHKISSSVTYYNVKYLQIDSWCDYFIFHSSSLSVNWPVVFHASVFVGRMKSANAIMFRITAVCILRCSCYISEYKILKMGMKNHTNVADCDGKTLFLSLLL